MAFGGDTDNESEQSPLIAQYGSRQHSLRLLSPVASEAKPSETLWLCLNLPRLAVEVVDGNASQPTVITTNHVNRVVIHAVNESAEEHGIATGQALSSALALVHDLTIYPRQEKKEQQALHKLAQFAYQQLSNAVSLGYSNSIVIEVGHSRQLWKRLEAIKQVVSDYLVAQGLTASVAWAPTARAAHWLACSGSAEPVLSMSKLSQALFGIGLDYIVEPDRLQSFHNSGINTLGDVMRLPRDGLARRGGRALLQQIDEAMGRRAEPIKRWYPLAYFLEDYELSLPSSELSLLRPIVQSLCESLVYFLRQRQVVTRRVQIRFLHRRDAASVMVLGFSRYVLKTEDLMRVFDAQLSNFSLKKEALTVELCCRQFQTINNENNDFLDFKVDGKESWQQLQELFDARLGEDYFKPLINNHDHRPEYAMKLMDSVSSEKNNLERPLWLLAKAQQLTEINKVPYWHGQLHLAEHFERIEQGWWQGDDIRRDYFIAKTDAGAKVWVYRDLRQGQWFLHGVFG